MEQAAEFQALAGEAVAILARADGNGLEELEARACALLARSLSGKSPGLGGEKACAAGLRGLALALEATGRNLDWLRQRRSGRSQLDPWA